MSKARMTLDMSSQQMTAIEVACELSGLTKAQYIRQAVELLTTIFTKQNYRLILRDLDTGEDIAVFIPGITRGL
jgi:predicted metal-dependent peptidase